MLCGLSRETPGEAGKSWGPAGRVMGLSSLELPGRRLGLPLPRDPKPGESAGQGPLAPRVGAAHQRTLSDPDCHPAILRLGSEPTRLFTVPHGTGSR